MLFKLGMRNITRKKSRSLLTISAVVLCSMGIMVFMVLMEGVTDMMMSGVVSQAGHYQLLHEKVAKQKRLYRGTYFVEDAKRLLRELSNTPGIVSVAPRIEVGAYLDHKGIQAPAGGLGIDPKAERVAMKLHEKLAEGRMLRNKGREVVLGWRLARRLKAKPGSSVVLLGQTVEDSISAVRAKVVGISRTGVAQIDKMFFVSIPVAQYFLDIPNQVSSILLYARTIHHADKLNDALSAIKLPKGVIKQHWRQSSSIAAMLPMMDFFIYFLGGLIVFIAGIGLMNTMTMSVMERKSEVGLMMALGMSPSRVASVFLMEGLVLGLIGAVIGVALATICSIPLIVNGVSLQGEAVANMPFPLQKTIKGSLTYGSVVTGLLIGVLSTLVGTTWPAIQAARLQPVDALREEHR